MNQLATIKVDELKSLIKQGVEAWTKAGEIVVDMIDREGMTIAEIATASGLASNILSRFEQLGRKTLMPYLLLGGFAAAPRMMHIPYSDQRRLQDEPVHVLVQDESGEWSELQVQPKNLTATQAAQVFGRGVVRDSAAQRAYIESERAKKQSHEVRTVPYHIVGKEVVFEAGAKLTASQISSILGQLVK